MQQDVTVMSPPTCPGRTCFALRDQQCCIPEEMTPQEPHLDHRILGIAFQNFQHVRVPNSAQGFT